MIEPSVLIPLRNLLIQHEGVELTPYRCTSRKLTIGVGRNLEDIGISYEEAMILLGNDITRVSQEAEKALIWLKRLNAARQVVILSMIFNVGMPKFLEFKKMIRALESSEYKTAAEEMLNSLWAIQVKGRATDLATLMKTGSF